MNTSTALHALLLLQVWLSETHAPQPSLPATLYSIPVFPEMRHNSWCLHFILFFSWCTFLPLHIPPALAWLQMGAWGWWGHGAGLGWLPKGHEGQVSAPGLGWVPSIPKPGHFQVPAEQLLCTWAAGQPCSSAPAPPESSSEGWQLHPRFLFCFSHFIILSCFVPCVLSAS